MAKTKEDLFQKELVKFILNWCKDNDMPPFELNGVYTGSHLTLRLTEIGKQDGWPHVK